MVRFALGMVLVEATNTLNRDLAAHSGRLTVNAELLLKALVQRDLTPRFDDAIGRPTACREPRSRRPFASHPKHLIRCAPGLSS